MTTTVSQEAREAAADLYLALDGGSVDPSDIAYANAVRTSRCDDCAAVQAFAKFEQSIRQQAEREEEEAHKIGIDEGRQEMIREIDLATGGDGEFRYCMNGDPDRHCPDAEAMKARVLDRFAARHRQSAERGEVDRLRSELNKVRGILERLRDFDGWQGTFHAGHAYDAKQDAIAYLEGTSHAD